MANSNNSRKTNQKSSFIEKLFYNNKFLLAFSIVVSVIVWAIIAINYSDDSTRIVSDVQISVQSILSTQTEYVAFYSDEDLVADVEVMGSAYNINQYNFDKDDITLEVKSEYVYETGYRILTLVASVDSSISGDVEVVSISPSTITVYYDRSSTETFNVLTEINQDIDSLVEGSYTVGQAVPSMTTVEVTGPSTILDKIESVYFEVEFDESSLPLTQTTEVEAEISFGLTRSQDEEFLTISGITDGTMYAAVTIPVYANDFLPLTVKFVNQPSIYSSELPEYTIDPEKVEVSYSSSEATLEAISLGSIDFRTLTNDVNVIEISVADTISASLVDTDLEIITVTIDFSDLDQLVVDESPSKIVLSNKTTDYEYSVDLGDQALGGIVIVGPAESLAKITAEDLQIEINVSGLSLSKTSAQTVDVSNITIVNDEINDCWIVGEYEAQITVTHIDDVVATIDEEDEDVIVTSVEN